MSEDRAPLAGIDVVVLAGGLGTRIRSVLGDTPKVLAPIAGRAFLGHLLSWLAGYGATRTVLCLGHRAVAVEDWLVAHGAPDGMTVDTVTEPEPLGTGGALRHARRAFRSDPVMVINGDTFVDAALDRFVAAHRAAAADASVLCVNTGDVGRYGRVVVGPNRRIVRFSEKDPADGGAGLINAGLYLFGAAWLDRLAAGGAVSLERDVLAPAPPGTLHAVIDDGSFIDIGTPESLAEADAVFGRLKNVAGEYA